jgi:hypothetical protein
MVRQIDFLEQIKLNLMLDTHYIYNDTFAQRRIWSAVIDARIKIVFLLIALAMNIVFSSIWPSLVIAVICLSVLLLIRIPPKPLLVQLTLPLAMATVVAVTQ